MKVRARCGWIVGRVLAFVVGRGWRGCIGVGRESELYVDVLNVLLFGFLMTSHL